MCTPSQKLSSRETLPWRCQTSQQLVISSKRVRAGIWPAHGITQVPGKLYCPSARLSPQLRLPTALSSLARATHEAIRRLEGRGCGSDLFSARVYLLVGLYQAQCARVSQSRAYLRIAGEMLRDLIFQHKLFVDESGNDTGVALQNQVIPNQQLLRGDLAGSILMPAWSCLQLEADSFRETDTGSSPLHEIMSNIQLPPEPSESKNLRRFSLNDQHDDKRNFQDYLAFTFADRQLRLVRDEIRGYNNPQITFHAMRSSLQRHTKIVLDWRDTLPQGLKWLDGEKPPLCVFEAHTRAKYYQTIFKIHQPHLDFALNILPHLQDRSSVRDVVVKSHRKRRDVADIRLLEAIREMDESELNEACHQCIEAATQVVTAFDGVSDCLTLPNLHEIAHA